MPHFRKGYDERLDLTEDEWLEQQMYDSMGEYDEVWPVDATPQAMADADDALALLEGEPNEDTYFPGIPDYDRFNRPSWETDNG